MKMGVSYFGNRIPEHYRSHDLPDIVAAGCTYVVHTFSENDVRFYAGSLRDMVKATHQAGLEVYVDPWGVGGVFAGEAFSDFLPQHPDAWQVMADGTRIPAACPNNPEFQAFMRLWLEVTVELGPDVIYWDDPHLYIPPQAVGDGQEWTCHCGHCRGLYRQRYGEPMPPRMTSEVVEFREETLLSFIASGCAYVKEQGIRNSVGLLPFDDPEHGFVHWEKIAAIDGVDMLAVSPFWHLFHKDRDQYVGYWARKTADVCQAHGKEPVVWLQGFLIEAGQEVELAATVEAAYDAGVRNVAVWGYRGCGHMSSIRCQRPEVMWRVTGETFRALKSRG
jgi:hypothetical protein